MVHKEYLHTCWYSWTLFPKICSVDCCLPQLGGAVSISLEIFCGDVLFAFWVGTSAAVLWPLKDNHLLLRQLQNLLCNWQCWATITKTDNQDNIMAKQRAEDTENTYFKKILVPNECRWISVLPLLGCPRRVFLMLQFINNLVDKQSRKTGSEIRMLS